LPLLPRLPSVLTKLLLQVLPPPHVKILFEIFISHLPPHQIHVLSPMTPYTIPSVHPCHCLTRNLHPT
jgi:hypothetical protein